MSMVKAKRKFLPVHKKFDEIDEKMTKNVQK
jgi:hypothetical protein